MQVFVPYANYFKSAKALDIKRRNKQILENMQIISANTKYNFGWKIPKYIYNHPNVLLWKDDKSINYLYHYTMSLFTQYHKAHNYQKTHKSFNKFFDAFLINHTDYIKLPKHLTPDFCKQHQQILLQKNYEHYSKYFGENS